MKFSAILKSTLLIFLFSMIVSCVGTQSTHTADQAQAPTVAKLEKKYNNLYLAPFTAKSEVSEVYPQAADTLLQSMRTALKTGKSFKKVSAGSATAKPPADNNTLIIKANILDMRIVSSSARMWGGAFAGSSGIEFDLQLIDAASGNMVREQHMSSWNNAFAASYSGGTSDTSLLNDMGKITAQYIVDAMPVK
jgi:hypothetical protein